MLLKFLMVVMTVVTMFGHSESKDEWNPELVQRNVEEIEIIRDYVEESHGLEDVGVEKTDDGTYTYVGYDEEDGHRVTGEYNGSIEYAEEYVENSKTNVY